MHSKAVAVGPETVVQARPLRRPDMVAAGDRLSSGDHNLDSLLGGGYPRGSAMLLHGPPFSGKQQMLLTNVRQALHSGMDATFVLHNTSATEMSLRLRRSDVGAAKAQRAGRVSYVDTSSFLLGEPQTQPHTTYVKDPTDLEALEEACIAGGESTGPRLLAVESVSTIMVDMGPTRAISFLRSILGRTIRDGGVGILALQADMHSQADEEATKHLCAGLVEMRRAQHAYHLRVQGIPGQPIHDWVDYTFDADSFHCGRP